MARRTAQKPIRMEAEIVALVASLRHHYPELSDDTKVLDACVRLGGLLLATQATRPGAPPYAGYDPIDLAAQLGPKLLPALDFLLQHGWRTALLRAPSPESAPAPSAPELAAGQIDPDAAADVAGLGIDFLDED